MITIRNVKALDSDPDNGLCLYEVAICGKSGTKPITTFKHRRADGLERCLGLATRAVGAAQWRKLQEAMDQSAHMTDAEEAEETARRG